MTNYDNWRIEEGSVTNTGRGVPYNIKKSAKGRNIFRKKRLGSPKSLANINLWTLSFFQEKTGVRVLFECGSFYILLQVLSVQIFSLFDLWYMSS